MSSDEALARRLEVERLALGGDPGSKLELARRLLSEPPPSAQKNRRAVRMLEPLLAPGFPGALHLWGLVLMRGQGKRRDLPQGAQCLYRAALAGVPAAQADYALALELGAGTAPSPEAALYWRKLAAAAGRLDCALEAGRSFRDGRGAPGNFAEAERWMRLAAEGGVAAAQYELALLHLFPQFEGRSAQSARQWMRRAASAGDARAQYRLGLFYWSGTGGRVNLRLAARALIRSAGQDFVPALEMLAQCLSTGNGLPLDRQAAWVLCRRAQKLGSGASKAEAKRLANLLDPSERTAGRRLLAAHPSTRSLLSALLPQAAR